MPRGFEAVSTVVIDAPRAKVWDALTDPMKVKQYMHGTNLTTDWKVGSPIAWRGVWKGKSYEDRGTVLEIEPGRLLMYTHWSPMGGSQLEPDAPGTQADGRGVAARGNVRLASRDMRSNGGRREVSLRGNG